MISRREFLSMGAMPLLAAAEKKPNILFIISDDHHWQCLGAAGNPNVKTPNLAKLAARGVRFTNALISAGCTPAEITWKAGVDVLSFGGTKNGCMGVEAVVIFDPARAAEFEFRRKRAGHLFSKHRYLSAQMLAYLTDDLWLWLAHQANTAARNLSEGLRAIPAPSLVHPTEANAVFAAWPRNGHQRAEAGGARYYLWPCDQSMTGPADETLAARLVCSWSTTEADVEGILTLIRG